MHSIESRASQHLESQFNTLVLSRKGLAAFGLVVGNWEEIFSHEF